MQKQNKNNKKLNKYKNVRNIQQKIIFNLAVVDSLQP